jgi:very-short-patch-repair endonuclease
VTNDGIVGKRARPRAILGAVALETRKSGTTSTGSRGVGVDSAVSKQSPPHLVSVLGMVSEVRVAGTRDERIAAIARLQRGRVARRQLRAAGLSYDAISRRVARGFLHPIHSSVFALGHAGPIELGEETAALLAVREGALLADRSAARLWGMSVPDDGTIHVVLSGNRGPAPSGVTVHRSRVLSVRDRRIRKGLPVISPARALLDLAVHLATRRLELALDHSLVAHIVRLDDVAELLTRARGHPGAAILRALLDKHRHTTLTRSEAEEMFLALIRRAGLPEPEVNVKIANFEVDFVWPDQRLAVEIDSFEFHSTPWRFERDYRKDSVLRAAELDVLRFTYWQIETDPLVVVAGVARRL